MYLPNPSTAGRMWHNGNFLSGVKLVSKHFPFPRLVAKEQRLLYNLSIHRVGGIDGFMPFPRALILNEKTSNFI